MKEIQIVVRIDGEKSGTVIKKIGFNDEQTIEELYMEIGILENLKQNVLNKLNNKNIK